MLPPDRVRVLPERDPVRLDKRGPGRVTTRGVFGGVFGNVAELVARPIRTLGGMLRRPGQLVREYLQGNREESAGPFLMAFLGVSLFLFVNSALASDMSAFFDPLVWLREFWPYLAPVVLLPVAALQRRLFSRAVMTFGDTYAFGLYMLGQIAVFRTALLVIRHYTGIGDVYSSDAARLVTAAIMAIEAGYVAWAATGFYHDRRLTVWLRGALSYVAFAALGYLLLNGLVYYVFRGLFS